MVDEGDTMNRLRERAEKEVTAEGVELEGYSQQDLEQLIHELRVHQVELEMQNESLHISQSELLAARDEYTRRYNQAPVGYFSVGGDGRIKRVNRTGARLLDGEADAFVDSPFGRYIAPESQDDYHRFLLRLVQTGATEATDVTMRDVQGRRFRVRIEGISDDPASDAWRAVVSDLTARYEAEEALRESEARYRQLVEYAPAGIYEVDVPSGRFLTVNDVMCELTGYTRDELLGMTGFDLTDEEGRALFQERLQRQLEGKPVPESVEYRVRRKDGSWLWARIHTRVVYEGAKAARIFVVGYDITERKHAEEDLRLIMEGTAALTGRDFFRALVRYLAHLLRASYALVGWLDVGAAEDGGTVVHTRAVWAEGDWVENLTFDLRGSACEPVVRGEECYHPQGVRDRFAGDPLVARWGVESYRALPLRDIENETQGVLIVMDSNPMDEDPRAEPILNIFAGRAGAELMRQESEAALRRYANQQAALYAVATTLTTSLDPRQLLDRVLAVVAPVFQADAAWVTVAGSAAGEAPSILASRGLGEDVDLESLAAPLDTCPACTEYLEGPRDAAPRVIYRCDELSRELLTGAGVHSQACLPLVAHGSTLGVLTLGWQQERELARSEEGLLLAIGFQVSLSLHNARLYQQTRQVDRLYLLAELNDALVATLDPAEVARLSLQAIAAAARAAQGLLLPYTDSLGHYPDRVLALGKGWIDLDASETYRDWQPVLERLRQQRIGIDHVPRSVSLTEGDSGDEFLVVPLDDNDLPLGDLVLSGSTFAGDDLAVAWAAAGRAGQAIRNAHLYEEVRQLLREREETQAQLVHSEKMAALGRLTASVSHEINNPVQAVLGCLGLAVEELDEDADEETVDRYLAIAMQELRRIATIVRRMREFYRPAEHEWDVVDINDTVQAVIELARNELTGRDVAIELDLAQVPRVPMRPDQMRQVFLNLILNAADAMPSGGTLTVRTRVESARLSRPGREGRGGSAPSVRVDFGDTGIGIDPGVRARLFEPFFTTKRDGSGLGLYISHGIVETHGGNIEVGSREGGGTIVRVWLPLMADGEQDNG